MLNHFSLVQLFVALWTVAHQAPLCMGFSRQEYWNGLPCPPPGDLPHPGIKLASLMSPALVGGFCTTGIKETQIGITTRCHLILVRMYSVKKSTNKKMLERVWRKGNSPTLLVGMWAGVDTMENSTEVPQKTKNRVVIWSNNPTPGQN